MHGGFHRQSGSGDADINTSKTASTSTAAAAATWLTTSGMFLDSLPDLEKIPGSERRSERVRAYGSGSLGEQLEEVTRERDMLKVNQEKLVITWMRRVKGLEEQLDLATRAGGQQQPQEVRTKSGGGGKGEVNILNFNVWLLLLNIYI